jgi:ubiquitin C-terminal hydrolase
MSSTRKAIKKRGKNSQKNNREEVESRRRRALSKTVSTRRLSHLSLKLPCVSTKATDPRREYHLLALLVHMGSGPTQGHYLTVVHFRELWMALNDEQGVWWSRRHSPRAMAYHTRSLPTRRLATLLFYQANYCANLQGLANY